MRPLDPTNRLSALVSVNISKPLSDLLDQHCTEHKTKPATVLRNALVQYFDAPPNNPNKPDTPDDAAQTVRTINTTLRTDSHTYASTRNPKPNPHATLRDRLDLYCRAHNIQASIVIRRALYRYLEGK